MLPPKIDPREVSDLIAQMKEMAPFYTPEWRFTPEDPDPGSALFLMFSQMFHENIKRLNRVPTKNLISFLNMFDVTLLPARPASAYVTFALNEGTRESVLIPAGTKVTAAGDDGDILYETDRTALLTPAVLKTAYLSSRKQDAIIRIPDEFLGLSAQGQALPTQLFRFQGGVNLQEHALYLEHGSLFTLSDTARIEIEISNSTKRYEEARICSQLADDRLVEWMYATAEGWAPFDRVEASDNRIVLTKGHRRELVESEVNGVAGRWIVCRLKPVRPGKGAKTLADSRLSLDKIAVKTDYVDVLQTGGIPPEQMFFNDIESDPSGFYPFGDQFAVYGTFYLSSQEAFSKRDSDITISFNLKAIPHRFQPEYEEPVDWKPVMKKNVFDKTPDPEVTISQVVWEYWNGVSWVRLAVSKEAEQLFTVTQEGRKELTFRCPEDLEPTYVNGNENWWIRVRILQMENAYAPQAIYQSPWMDGVTMTYNYGQRLRPLMRCMALNNTVYADLTRHSRQLEGGFEPFQPLPGQHPTLYLGWDAPPLKGPISIYVSVRPQRLTERDIPLLEWEYLRAGLPGASAEWATLKVIDGTNGLTQSGTLQFVGPADFAVETLFGSEGSWIRAVNRDNKYEDKSGLVLVPTVNGLYLNTVRVVQQETIVSEEPLERNDEMGGYQLSRGNVVSEEVWVDESGYLKEEQIVQYEIAGTPVLDVYRDTDGNVQHVWVLWTAVTNFGDSGSRDRHYTIDRTFGRIRFGDGINGMEPPTGGLGQVEVTYKVTSGQVGNVGARQIINLQDSIAFVGEVYNPEPASGGCQPESMDSALARGPQMLKNRDRAVTAEDFEWLAREAYPNIAKVKCMANYNAYMSKEIGSMTLVILPKEGQQGGASFPALKKRVETYLLKRAASLVAFPERIQVIEPVYMEISVSAIVAVEGMDAVVPTELAALDKLQNFLNPLRGNFDGTGWEIGQQVHPSVFYALLKSIRAINHVEKLYMTVYKVEDGVRTELDVNNLPALPHAIVISGRHNVVVNAL